MANEVANNYKYLVALWLEHGRSHREIAWEIANLSQRDDINLNDLTDIIVNAINIAKHLGKIEK